MILHVQLYVDSGDDSDNRNGDGEKEEPGYYLLKHSSFLASWTNYFFG